jgi:hypothetical protein
MQNLAPGSTLSVGGRDRVRQIRRRAGHLHVSPYVASPCFKAREQRVGQVLVLREKPSGLTYFESDVDLEP